MYGVYYSATNFKSSRFREKKKLTLKYRTEPGLLPQQTIQLPQLQAHLNYSSLIDESHFSI